MNKVYTYIIKHLVQFFGVHNKFWITNHVVYCICLDKKKEIQILSGIIRAQFRLQHQMALQSINTHKNLYCSFFCIINV